VTHTDSAFFAPKSSSDLKRCWPLLVEWVMDSGCDFFTALLGDEESARATIGEWVRSRDSEFSGYLSSIYLRQGDPAGVVIAVRGDELPARRRSDLLTLVKGCTPTKRARLRESLYNLSHLTAPVEPDDYYIRTVAVAANHRSQGVGRQLVARAIRAGQEAGFRRFRLDVQIGNEPALRLYRGFGFECIAEGHAPVCGFGMQSMLLKAPGERTNFSGI
jgi:ribosomal protein S18 acetylase RimI-like enzyme